MQILKGFFKFKNFFTDKGVLKVTMQTNLFSRTEEQLMNFMWQQGEPISIMQISEQWAEKEITDHHLRVILKSLEKKKAVECCGSEQRGRQYSRIFRCRISKEEYYTKVLDANGVTLDKLLQVEAVALSKTGNDIELDDLIQKLQAIIDEYRDRDEDESSTGYSSHHADSNNENAKIFFRN